MPNARDLPEVGMITGRGDTANVELLLKANPDLIVDFGSVRGTYVSLADATQSRTGIPYVLIDGRFEATAASLRLLGGILGAPERGEALAKYTEDLFARLDAVLAAVPEAQRPRVYLARGVAEGSRGGTIHAAASCTGAPFQSIAPASAGSSPSSARSKVLLPAPMRPVTTVNEPGGSARSIPSMPFALPG